MKPNTNEPLFNLEESMLVIRAINQRIKTHLIEDRLHRYKSFYSRNIKPLVNGIYKLSKGTSSLTSGEKTRIHGCLDSIQDESEFTHDELERIKLIKKRINIH